MSGAVDAFAIFPSTDLSTRETRKEQVRRNMGAPIMEMKDQINGPQTQYRERETELRTCGAECTDVT